LFPQVGIVKVHWTEHHNRARNYFLALVRSYLTERESGGGQVILPTTL